MKINRLHQPLFKHILTKLIALIFGYSFWIMLVQTQSIVLPIDIPLCFYGVDTSLTFEAPETIKCLAQASRREFCVPKTVGAAHIDASFIKEAGTYQITVMPEQLFLRNEMNLVNYKPQIITVNVTRKDV